MCQGCGGAVADGVTICSECHVACAQAEMKLLADLFEGWDGEA